MLPPLESLAHFCDDPLSRLSVPSECNQRSQHQGPCACTRNNNNEHGQQKSTICWYGDGTSCLSEGRWHGNNGKKGESNERDHPNTAEKEQDEATISTISSFKSNNQKLEDADVAHYVAESRHQQAQRYGANFICLLLLERWLELGVRPSHQELFQQAISSLWSTTTTTDKLWLLEGICQQCKEPVDNLQLLQQATHHARRQLWHAALDPSSDDHLEIRSSNIPGAQLGLFAAVDLPAYSVCCYYHGNVHDIKSSQTQALLPNGASYLLQIGTLAAQPWWYDSLLQEVISDDNDLVMVNSNNCNTGDHSDNRDNPELDYGATVDSSSSGKKETERILYAWLRNEWDQLMKVNSSACEILVDPTNTDIKARYINDCLTPSGYNVAFVLDPTHERAAVVTLRNIQAGEELYVSYGQAYWDSLEASTGIVPKRLPMDDLC
jgi:hypothetical protein